MKTANLYIRVSTDEQADKGYSQRNQDEVLRRYCQLQGIKVQDVIFEDHSAKTFNRPEWVKMLNKLKKAKGKATCDYILFTKWDRFSRNTSDAYQMIALLRTLGVEPQAIEQPLDLEIPENKMMLAFYLAVPEVENDRRALNIFHGMRRAKKEGRWIASAPTGYVNRTTENGRKYIRPDEPLAGIMKNAFKEIATGKYAVEQVWKQARRQGLSCTRNNFWNLIRNPVYCGMIVVPAYKEEKQQWVDGQHEAIITPELFCKVQDVLDGRKRTGRGTKITSPHILLLRGFIACSRCGRLLTGSASKGRNAHYHYYHCAPSCSVRYKADEINTAICQLFKSIVPKKPFTGLFKEIARDVFKQRTIHKQNARQQSLLQLEIQQNRLTKARELLLNDALTAPEYQDIKKECEQKIAALQNALITQPDMDASITQLLNRHNKRMLDLYQLYDKAGVVDRRSMLSAIFVTPIILSVGGQPLTQVKKIVELILLNKQIIYR